MQTFFRSTRCAGRFFLDRCIGASFLNLRWAHSASSSNQNRSLNAAAVRYIDTSSAASRLEVNTAIFNHCVMDGHISLIPKISDHIPEDFKAAVLSSESVFHQPATRNSESLFRSALFKHIKQMLVHAQVLMKSFLFI